MQAWCMLPDMLHASLCCNARSAVSRAPALQQTRCIAAGANQVYWQTSMQGHLFDACCPLCEEKKKEERGCSAKQVQAVPACWSCQHPCQHLCQHPCQRPGQTSLLSVQSQLAELSCNVVHYRCSSCKVVNLKIPARVSVRVSNHVAAV